MDEEALIEAVLALRRDGKADSAAQALAALQADGKHADLTLSQVKKACSKATKRQPKSVEAPPSENTAPDTNTAGGAKQAKQAKAAVSAMKAAETAMMRAQRLLRLKKAEDDVFAEEARFSAIVGESDRGEAFIQQCSGRALAASLEDGDAECLEQRVEADLATLEWMLLAETAGTLVLPDDARGSTRAQVARLKAVRGAKDRAATLACFVNGDEVTAKEAPPVPDGPVTGDYLQSVAVDDRASSAASLDRAIAAAGGLSIGATGEDPMDDVD